MQIVLTPKPPKINVPPTATRIPLAAPRLSQNFTIRHIDAFAFRVPLWRSHLAVPENLFVISTTPLKPL